MAASRAISYVAIGIGAVSVMDEMLEGTSANASLAGRVIDLVSLAIGIDGSIQWRIQKFCLGIS
ncbi:hypothetical protein Bca52824_032790 [Brassica carinata]|uniref:Uncharacterized protein n=1 Tax=Brassica carinata TaxID=52824 RepID=A0A8X7V6I5_BRACI|nr:hypothetical protein Bca52824_032790 [Brassica carinata]